MKPNPPLPATILMTADTVGGVWTYAIELCRALSHTRIVLATMGRLPDRQQRRAAAALPNVQLEVSDFPLEWMPDPWAGVDKAGEWLLSLEKIHRPDLIHLNGFVHGSLPWRAPCLVVAHSCVLSWWRAVKGEDAPPEWKRYAAAVSAGLRAADAVVAPTGAMADCLAEHYGFPGEIRVIQNARQAPPSSASAEKEQLVFCAGRLWDEGKNVMTLAYAAPDLPWPVILAGDAPGDESIGGNVKLLGRLDSVEVRQWMGRSAIYAWPALYEPFGLSVLEAAQAGCALILSDIPSLRELWDGAALFVAPNDSDAWRRTLHELISNPAKRRMLADMAARRARLFTPGRMAAGYQNLYAKLMTMQTPQPESIL